MKDTRNSLGLSSADCSEAKSSDSASSSSYFLKPGQNLAPGGSDCHSDRGSVVPTEVTEFGTQEERAQGLAFGFVVWLSPCSPQELAGKPPEEMSRLLSDTWS